MKSPGGLAAVTLLLLVFAMVEIRAAFAQAQRRTITYTDGSRYDGEIHNGKWHGLGTYIYSDGSRYAGDWRDGKKHGQGTYTWPDGGRYEGEFRYDRLHGRGIRTWSNGERYVGEYRDDKRTGQGTYTWPNGHRYEGQWVSNRKHGQGTYSWPNGERYVGAYRDGKRTGHGTYAWPDGGRYVGEWRADKKHGRGTRTWPNGRRYEGQWRSDRMHGRGTMIRADGSSYEGEWRDGRRSDDLAQERQRQMQQQAQAREGRERGQAQRSFSDPKAEERRLGLNQTVRRGLQSCLKIQGFDPGPSDGVFGPRTRAAIRAWQVARGQGQHGATGYVADRNLGTLLAGCRVAGEGESESLRQARLLAQDREGQRRVEQERQRTVQLENERNRETQRQMREEQRQREAAATPESGQGSDYWRHLEHRRQQEQQQAVNTQQESENRRQARRQAQEQQRQGAATQSRRQTESVNSAELFHWFSRGESPQSRGKILDLLGEGAAPNVADAAGNTPMHYAALHIQSETILLVLIRNGGRCDRKNADGETPLHFAANVNWSTHWDVPQRLTDCGADPNAQDKRGNTPLHMAFLPLARRLPWQGHIIVNAESHMQRERMISRLIAYGADPNIKNADGDTVLILALKLAARPRIIELLLAHDADPNTQDKRGTPALVLTLSTYDEYYDRDDTEEIIDLLLRAGADPNGRGAKGRTALHLAAENPHFQVVQSLLDGGADPNSQDEDGDTPLHTAAAHAGLNVVDALLEWEADVCLTNKEGNRPHDYARSISVRNRVSTIRLPDGADICGEQGEAQAEQEQDPSGTRELDGTAVVAEVSADPPKGKLQPGSRFRDCPECPEMVVVPAGSFMMGSPPDEEWRYDDEGPQHRVTIAEPFAVGVYEVTFREWDACASGGGCNGYRPRDLWGRGDRPVIYVSWDDAQAYVHWLSRKTGERYRLLSESEWEYAARAGTTGPFHTGPTISTDQANYYDEANYYNDENYKFSLLPVGSFGANGFGLHDVHGNVREWTEDCPNANYRGAPVDGSAWNQGECGKRVVRGGSYGNAWTDLRAASRSSNPAEYQYRDLGFRIARTLTP